jgi:hypothetical protein
MQDPKCMPMRMVKFGGVCWLRWGRSSATASCMDMQASTACSAVAKVAMISSPMVLMTAPGYQLTGDGIAEGFVEACAAADVRKYDRPRSGLFRHAQTVLRASNPIIRCRYPPSPALQITSMAEAASYTYVFDSYDKGRSRRVMKQVTGED